MAPLLPPFLEQNKGCVSISEDKEVNVIKVVDLKKLDKHLLKEFTCISNLSKSFI